ncbi:MAG: hypothetical protein HUJ31_17610, partial [Pseudomonadales bacterium]|nr:hypothetical protein [Pseudomonadales bacterium]
VKVFYPGVASWEFLLSGDHGQGAQRVRSMQKSCAECHVGDTGEYDIYADKIITGELEKSESGDALEPDPIEGQPGFKEVSVQVAHDAENIYVRLSWPGAEDSIVSMQVANQIKTFEAYGCYITCHDDQKDMPADNDQTLYAYFTHSGDKIAPQPRLDSHIEKQQFMDLWLGKFEGGKVSAEDEYILEARHDDNNDLSASGSFEGGINTVVLTRKLSTGDDKDIQLSDGSTFSIGIAVHDAGRESRFHHTSFPVSVGLGAGGDITSKKM